MKSIRVGPVLLCLGVALARAVWLAAQISGVTVSTLSYLLLADVPVIGLLGLLAALEFLLPPRWRLMPLLAALLVTALYLADVAVVVALNARLQFADVARFGGEWWLLPSYLSPWAIVGVLTAVGACLLSVRVRPATVRRAGTAAVVLWLAPLAVQQRAIPPHLHKYTTSVLGIGREFAGLTYQPMPRYTVGDYDAYRDDYERMFDVPFIASRRNVVLVIVESLSAADSARSSGLGQLLERFDALSEHGTLFTNFLANFEASEGGIIALLSGVPPLHFPTASTDTFAEYALQPAVTAQFARAGYRCEFLTSVPLQFISMDRYMTSPSVGFHAASGQREIARYRGAPRYAFQSPADHLLYEEVLDRVGTSASRQQPVFVAAVTASSHPPYVDPLGRANAAPEVWGYVQDELWWLYEQLQARGFFENGLLVITGDHRKMLPVTELERQRYGDSAKARVPLAIIGAGVPAGVVDGRLFQQADLLRMLDRVGHPERALSPFAIWVERYVYVFGVASNASRLEVFHAADGGRLGHQARLRGAEIDWVTVPPAQALAIEGAIHRQRVAQQAQRAASIQEEVMAFGRELVPSEHETGMLVGRSHDVDPLRDPDDPRGELVVYPAASLGDAPPGDAPPGAPVADADVPSTVTIRAFLPVDVAGEYWFSVASPDAACLAIDKRMVLACVRGVHEGSALLTAGLHRFDLRFVRKPGAPVPELKWLPVGASTLAPFPLQRLRRPRPSP